ncbi:MAG TPA: type II toxin-antitoxin system RelE/ParE family toxin [Planctomycetota bacterium]|nr:type II toxin-antitoxin system RelE/ParE family toxin [Planctomycetota bacterium]
MCQTGLTPEAFGDLETLRKFDRGRVLQGIREQLMHAAAVETHDRKRLRPNALAEWELRIGKFRVFYDIDEQAGTVKIEAVGFKEGSKLLIHGEEYQL